MSVYVTDTHALLWYFTSQHRMLSKRAVEVFEQAERYEAFIYIPIVSLWEVSRLDHVGAIALHEPFEDWVDALSVQPCFEFVPLDERVIIESRRYNFNRDIFDAAIVATAIVKDLPLITRDNAITDSGVVEVYW